MSRAVGDGESGGRAALAPREAAFDALRENLEAFAVAIVMALVIKHFCLEAFRIPTESMYPTLRGESTAENRNEDRILVDKWAYLFEGPQRGDVMVFRYPLDQSRNFIKRVAGLPGEWLKIAHGDLWTRRSEGDPWAVAAKRRRVREQVYKPVYPPTPVAGGVPAEAPSAVGTWWTAEERLDAWRVEDLGRFEFDGGAPARLVYAKKLYGDDGDLARDLRLRLRVTPRGPGTLALTWSPKGTWRTTLRLVCGTQGGDASGLAFAEGERELRSLALDAALAPGRPTDLEWEIVDGEVHVHLDGTERKVEPFAPPQDADAPAGTQALALTASGAAFTVEGLRIDRDLDYTLGGGGGSPPRPDLATGFRIPDDAYFMLGDNTNSSSDSRVWRAEGLRLKGGREVWWNVAGDSRTAPTSVPGTAQRHVVDLDGVDRHWEASDEDGDLGPRHVSFVPRAHVIGRAFYIFWPALPDFPNRLRWIH